MQLMSQLDVGRNMEEVKENTKEKEETMMVASGPKREERKERPVEIPYTSGFSEELRTFGEFKNVNKM